MIPALIVAIVILLAIGVFKPSILETPFRSVDTWLSAFAEHRFAELGIFFIALIASLAFKLFLPFPEPKVHDEFAYLLQADTFAHGRLTNPPHPHAEFFETFHVLQQPTYAAKYPPAQAMFLALGQIAGRPLYGVWLSTALAVAAIFWMLKSIVSPRWALVGAALVLFNAQVLKWNWNFWGGSVALFAAALMFGGVWRLIKGDWRWQPVALAGLGISLLALSRPFEGAVVTALSLGWLLLVVVQTKMPISRLMTLVPGVAVIAATMCFFFFYNYRLTGHPLTMAYSVYEKNYAMNPVFLWQKRGAPPEYHHHEMQKFYEEKATDFDQQQSFSGFSSMLGKKISEFAGYFWGWAYALFLIPLVWVLKRDPFAQKIAVIVVIFILFAFLPVTYSQPHYAAPAMPLFVALAVLALRQMSAWTIKGKGSGRFFVRWLTILLCCGSAVWFVMDRKAYGTERWEYWRPTFVQQLTVSGKRHLLFVRYADDHILDDEWVYNGADIDGNKVVWARDMGPRKDEALMQYFKDYTVLLIQPDDQDHLITQVR